MVIFMEKIKWFIKYFVEEVSISIGFVLILWVIFSTIDVQSHNLNTQEYANWNIWKLLTENWDVEEPIYDIPEDEKVRGRSLTSKINVEESPFIFLGEFKLTGYCGCAACCGKTDCKTATGTHATQGKTIAVDPKIIPYGSEVIIDGEIYIAEDCGGAIKGNRIDIFFNDHNEALTYGVKYSDVCIRR